MSHEETTQTSLSIHLNLQLTPADVVVAFTEGKRNIMTFLHVLSFLITGFIITFGTVILLGKPAPLISFWKECDGYEWRNYCTPAIPSGRCVN